MKKLLTNAIHNLWTSIAGTIAGVPVITDGINQHNPVQVVSGVAILILGLLAKEN